VPARWIDRLLLLAVGDTIGAGQGLGV